MIHNITEKKIAQSIIYLQVQRQQTKIIGNSDMNVFLLIFLVFKGFVCSQSPAWIKYVICPCLLLPWQLTKRDLSHCKEHPQSPCQESKWEVLRNPLSSKFWQYTQDNGEKAKALWTMNHWMFSLRSAILERQSVLLIFCSFEKAHISNMSMWSNMKIINLNVPNCVKLIIVQIMWN